MVFVTLSIDGEAGRGRTRMRWIDCSELIRKLGLYIGRGFLVPDDCAELLTSLGLHSKRTEPQRAREFARLHYRFVFGRRKGPKLTHKQIVRRLRDSIE